MAKRICVVGAGRWGRRHIATLQELGLLGGVVETDPATRDRLAATLGDVPRFSRVGEALARGFDGFTIATPAGTHAALASEILHGDTPVLVEKPMALSAAEARAIADLAERRGVNLMVGHVLLFHPAIQKIKQLIHDGKIGKLEYLYSNRLNLGTVRSEENILWSFAPHDVSIFQHLIEAEPLEVVSRGGTFVRPQIQDTTMTILSYPNNVVGHIFVSWLHPFKEHRLVVIGSKGMVSFEDSAPDRALRFYEKGIDWIRGEPITRDGPSETIEYGSDLPLTAELRYFADHLDGTPIELGDARGAVQVMDILEQASRSLGGPAPTAAAHPDAVIHGTSHIDDGATVGAGTRIWHFSHVDRGAVIGRDCTLGQNVYVAANVTIGDHVKIQNNVSVYQGVTLEDHVFCGPSMVFTNVPNPRGKYPQRGSEHYHRTHVQQGASIGANATIVCGNTIGRHAFIAAGAVVTHDVPDYALMMGTPARQKGWICECGERLPPFGRLATCRRCARRYRLVDGRLEPLAATANGVGVRS